LTSSPRLKAQGSRPPHGQIRRSARYVSTINDFWPNGTHFSVTVSAQREAGSQPISSVADPITTTGTARKCPDLGRHCCHHYVAREGMRRILA
jgi:hypothetical protein